MDFASLGIGCVAGITSICLLAGLVVKDSPLDDKWIPAICGGLGGVLGILGMYLMPNFPATDVITAAAVGIASGLAATGTHQVMKQLGTG